MMSKWTATIALVLAIYGCCCCFVVLPYSTDAVSAPREFEVGNGDGWREPPPDDADFYYRWASYRKFQLGDSLRFKYDNDTVFVVDKWGYHHCNTKEAYAAYSDGNNTVVELDRAGPVYIISGDVDHCRNGQRFQMVVIGSRSFSYARPPSPAPAPPATLPPATLPPATLPPATLSPATLPPATFSGRDGSPGVSGGAPALVLSVVSGLVAGAVSSVGVALL